MQDKFRIATDRTLVYENIFEDALDGTVDGLEVAVLLLLLGGPWDRRSLTDVFSDFASDVGASFFSGLVEVRKYYREQLNRELGERVLGPVSAEEMERFQADGYTVDEWLEQIYSRTLGALVLLLDSTPGGALADEVDSIFSVMQRDINYAFTSFTSELMRADAETVGRHYDGRGAQPSNQFIYWHLNSGSGICPECAPYLGVVTTGTDGKTKIPPLHGRCRCYLAPLSLASMPGADSGRRKDHFEWMSGLSRRNLEKVVGKKRARLVFDEGASVRDLYDEHFNLK